MLWGGETKGQNHNTLSIYMYNQLGPDTQIARKQLGQQDSHCMFGCLSRFFSRSDDVIRKATTRIRPEIHPQKEKREDPSDR